MAKITINADSGDEPYLKIYEAKLLPTDMGPYLAIFTTLFEDQDQDGDQSFPLERLKDRSSKRPSHYLCYS